MGWLLQLLWIILLAVIVFTFIAVTVMVLVYLERKVSGWMQVRTGPKHVGPGGSLQLVADMLKMLQKEHILPHNADRVLFATAPVIVATAALLDYVVLPFTPKLIVRDLNIGVLYFAAMSSLTVVGVLLGGWASNNKYSLLGGLRSASQMVSYEIPLGLAIIAVAMSAGTLSTAGIVRAQSNLWFLFTQPVAFLVFVIAATAELNRVPFDLPEAESELVAGYLSEYSPMRFALFQLGEYGGLFAQSALATTLFLGGWRGVLLPLPPLVWFFLKTYAMIIFLMWVRWTVPRFRLDQLLNLSWKLLLPLAILNLAVTGYLIAF